MSREIHLRQLGYEIILLCDPLSYSGIITVILSPLRNNVICRNNAQKQLISEKMEIVPNGGALRTSMSEQMWPTNAAVSFCPSPRNASSGEV